MFTLRYAMRMGALTALGLTLAGTHCGGDGTSTPDPTMPSASAPQLTSISPKLGPTSGGTVLTLTGANFKAGATVQVGATMATNVTVVSDTQITATLPAQPTAFGKVAVVVAAADGQKATNSDLFSYYAVTVDFGAAVNVAAGSGVSALALGDFNADGKMDVVTANNGSKDLTVMLSSANGSLNPLPALSTGVAAASALAVGDLNNDGKPDLAFINNLGTDVSVMLGTGNGAFAVAQKYAAGTGTRAILITDLNGDKKLDVVVVNNTKGVSVLLGDGTGKLGTATASLSGTLPTAIVAGDFNGDGMTDILFADGTATSGALLKGKGDGTLAASVPVVVGAAATGVASGDFNGDGKLDVAFLTGSGVSVTTGKGDATFNTAAAIAVGTVPQALAAGDFNGDGISDLVVVDVSNYMAYVYTGSQTGLGANPKVLNVGAGTSPLDVAIGDFDGDQRPDIATANQATSNVTILANKSM